ncbi:hypothetical protein MTP99_003459 [Tenebrio molitor]|nr:hypothetical protein MTP99_003459 [Tenebrio molitor]
MVNIRVSSFQDSDDPLAIIRKLFISFGNNKILRCVNTFVIIFHISFEDVSAPLMLRLSMAAVVNGVVVYTYCQTGQTIVDETGLVLDTLSQCSWYNWDYKNKQILLIFMANSLKPCTFTFAGLQVDKRLAVSILRSGYSYALILYNLKKN